MAVTSGGHWATVFAGGAAGGGFAGWCGGWSGTAAGDSRSEGNELNTRSVASLGLGPHASVDTFHTVMTDDPE